MNDSEKNLRNRAIKSLTTIGEMYPSGTIAKKLDGKDDHSFEAMVSLWIHALKGVSDERIQRGLGLLLESGNKFEPSVPEFLGYCQAQLAAHRQYTALPPDRHGVPLGHEPASIRHYPPSVQRQLKKIGMVPKSGETHHDYCMRCKD